MKNLLPPRWHKVMDDLWSSKGRTLLIVLSIAVGVQLFGGVFIAQEVMNDLMYRSYQAANPATITIAMPSFSSREVAAVADLQQVSAASAESATMARVFGAERAFNIDLIAPASPEAMSVNRVDPEEGAWPPGLREIVMERTSLRVLGAAIGDTITVEMPDGARHDLLISGTAHSLHVFPATVYPQLTGFVSSETLRWLGASSDYNRLLVVTEPEYERTPESLDLVATEIKRRLEADGLAVASITTRMPGENLVADQISGVTTLLVGIGAFSLLLSAFLVINTISAVLEQQKRQIGILKAVGATGPQVAWLYLGLVLAYGLLALLIALPLGIGFGYASVAGVLDFGNYDFDQFYVPLWVIGLMVASALVIPALAALFPVWRSGRVTVREAISDYGISLRSKPGLIDRGLSRLRGLPRPVMLSLRNTFRRRGRLILTLSTLTLAGGMFMGVINTRESLLGFLEGAFRLYNYDVQLTVGGLYPAATLEREAYRVEEVTLAEAWSFSTMQPVRADGTLGPSIVVYGVPSDTEMLNPTLLDGRWLIRGADHEIVVSLNAATDEAVGVGDTLVLRNIGDDSRWTVVGIAATTGERAVYGDVDEISAELGTAGLAGGLLFQTVSRDGATQTRAMEAVEERLKLSGIVVGSGITREDVFQSNQGSFNFIIGFMLLMAGLLAVVGGLGLASTMSLNVLERTREIGIMRGIGAGDRSLRGVVVIEGLVIAALSWLFSIPVSFGLAWGLASALGMAILGAPMRLVVAPMGIMIWLPLVLLLALIASLLPARRASRVSVREALAYE